jgi:peptidoglycan/xylan/chitin deacetylase (PgdA/CDA1 family)
MLTTETGTIITTCTAPGVIALTFDDGPLEYTNDLLDLLDDRDIQATFFVAGNNRAKGHIDDSSKPWPAVMRRMYSAGHHIASHTWTHRNLNEANSTIRRSEMIYNEMAFRNLFGWIPTYMRAPYLECNAASGCLDEMSELGYHVVDQNIDTKDYENDSPALIQISKDRYSSGVSSNSENNQYIVLAHDVHDQTVHNLTAFMIDTAQDRGYRLVTVGECLGDPRENWYRTVSRGRDATSTESATTTRTVPPTNVSVTTNTATATGGLVISPNQQCGGNTGYTCQGSAFGSCCSWYGYWYVFPGSIRRDSRCANIISVDRVKVTVEQAVIPTLGRARLPEVTFTTLPTAFVVLASGHHAETTVTRPAALSTGSGKYTS